MGIIHIYKGNMITYTEYEELRDKAKVTNYRVAKDLRLGLAFFYKWRTGGIKPREVTLKKITEYLTNKE